jgi:hypothetical protein
VRYLVLFPLSSSRVLSLCSYILSLLYMIAGCNVGLLTYLHLHLYPHMTNPINYCSFSYLVNFMTVILRRAYSKLDCRFSGTGAQNWASIVSFPTNSTQNSMTYKLTSGPMGWLAQHFTSIILCPPNSTRSSMIYKLIDGIQGW